MATILLPYAHPKYRWIKRVAIHLFNWVMWAVPALADCVAEDVGDTYQGMLTFIVAGAIGSMLGVQILGIGYLDLMWWQDVLATLAVYLLFGIFYHLHERRWGM